jgi:hypothetical protein
MNVSLSNTPLKCRPDNIYNLVTLRSANAQLSVLKHVLTEHEDGIVLRKTVFTTKLHGVTTQIITNLTFTSVRQR